MYILLVDDDVDVIEGMLMGVDFEKLGFSKVFVANDIINAKKILSENNINVLITDIEMPLGSGIELMEWIMRSNISIVTIFCTSYADFRYAKKAIEFKVFDYFLKPIAYADLELKIKNAYIEAAKFNKHSANEHMEREAKETFWTNVLTNNNAAMKTKDLFDYIDESKFNLSLINIFDKNIKTDSWKVYASKNIIEELLGNTDSIEIFYSPYAFLFLIITSKNNHSSKEKYIKAYEQIIKELERNLKLFSNCYYKLNCKIEEVKASFDLLFEQYQNCIMNVKTISEIEDYTHNLKSEAFETADCKLLMTKGDYRAVKRKVFDYIDKAVATNSVNFENFKILSIDFMQLVYTTLSEYEIDAHKLFYDDNFEQIRVKSLNSIYEFKAMIEYVLNITEDIISVASKESSIVSKVKEYIAKHIEEDLSRTEIASYVFLNPDYLARVFKQEEGIALGNYIIMERVERAKTLLAKTNLSINAISLKCGYDNFSHFSNAFKQKTGLSPGEYRKRNAI